jgi:V/A-type H+-transporting ATPase subunit D
MEYLNLKRRLATATRGHKLLKDKQDEMMRRYIALIKENYRLRKLAEEKLEKLYADFALAEAVISPEFLEEALMFPKRSMKMEISEENIMNVTVPKLDFFAESPFGDDDVYSYGFYNTSDELDKSLLTLREVTPILLKLAEVEKSANLLTEEIEKTRRRVNALEFMTIPKLQITIKYIAMRLDEGERGALTRLMKVKEMIAN